MKSIQVKFTLIMVGLSFFSLVILGGLSYRFARAMVLENIYKNMESITTNEALHIGDWIDKGLYQLDGLEGAPVLRQDNLTEKMIFLQMVQKKTGHFRTLGYLDQEGNGTDSKGSALHLSAASWFKKAVQGERVISDPTVSPYGLEVVLAIPVKENGQITGIVFGGIALDTVKEKILGIKIGETGYAYMVRGDGLITVHPDDDFVMKVNVLQENIADQNLQKAFQAMLQGKSGSLKYQEKGNDILAVYAPVPGTNWSLAAKVPEEEVTGQVRSLFTITVVVTLIILLFTGIFIALYVRKMTIPLKKLEAAAGEIAEGNLRGTRLEFQSADEIGRLGKSFCKMADQLKNILQRVQSSTELVAEASASLKNNAGQASEASDYIAEASVQVASAADEQLQSAETASRVVHHIMTAMEQVSKQAKDSAADAKNIAEETKRGQISVKTAVQQMENISDAVQNSAVVVTKLGESSKEIGLIINSIGEIAGQTNLLALNAAIEAARAGEHGKGFSVVAEEVHKLAEQSGNAAGKIAEIVLRIQTDAQNSVEAMQIGRAEVKKGNDVVRFAGEAFSQISSLIDGEVSRSLQMAEKVEALSKQNAQILQAVMKIQTATRQSAENAQTVSAGAQEQTASMQEIADASSQLADIAKELQKLVGVFHI